MTSVTQDRRFGVNAGMAVKVPCVVATTAAITLSGEQTIDGVAVVTDDRVLVKNQADTTENGIWVCDSGDWSRAVDADGIYDLTDGTLIPVAHGTAGGQKVFQVSGTNPITPGTSAITLTVSTTFTGISAFAATLLDDATAADARATLGAAASGANADITSMTGLTAPTAAANPVRAVDLQKQLVTAFTTGGSSTAYTLTPTPAITANASGLRFRVKFHAAAGATPTLAVSGQTAKSLKYYDANGAKQAITSSRVPIDWASDVEYDGTDWVVLDTVVPLVGVVQVIEATPITSVVTCGTVMPYDDTIPQNTEGNEVITVAITPTSATNRIRIEFFCSTAAAGNDAITSALFQDSTANAIAVASEVSVGTAIVLSLVHEMAAGTTSATTFKVRCGASTNTLYLNGDGAGARKFGGISAAQLRVTEIKV